MIVEEVPAHPFEKYVKKGKKKRSHRPKVRIETRADLWYKQVSLYVVWGWISIACPAAGFWALIVNDGGVFYNECYYMFYNGIVWYNAPKPYEVVPNINNGLDIFAPTDGSAPAATDPFAGIFGSN